MLLNFLYNHFSFAADIQARVKWQEKSVIVWDVSSRSRDPIYLVKIHLSNSSLEPCDMSLRNPGLGEWTKATSRSHHSTGRETL